MASKKIGFVHADDGLIDKASFHIISFALV